MSRAVMKRINGETLQRELKIRGLTPLQVDADTGRAPGYVAKAIRQQTIAANEVKMLEALYRIDPAAYVVNEDVALPTDQINMGEMAPGLTQERLEELIRQSVQEITNAIARSTSQLAEPLLRIAIALEAQSDEPGPAVLPWNVEGEEDDF